MRGRAEKRQVGFGQNIQEWGYLMFKFIKEMLIDPIKEGWEEGKAELAAEEAAKEEKRAHELAEAEGQVAGIPLKEKMLLALAAPFRAVALGRYVSLFAFDPETPKELPLDMYQTGILDDKLKEDLAGLLLRDFDISDARSAGNAAYVFAAILALTAPLNEGAHTMEDTAGLVASFNREMKIETTAFCLCVLAYIVTGCIDLGFFNKEEGGYYGGKIVEAANKAYDNWQEFGDDFLAGEKAVKLNNFLGQKILKNVVSTLLQDPGSPWKNVVWQS